MTGVSQILQEMAANAAATQLARGNRYADLIQGISNVPAQILNDQERQQQIDLQRAGEAQRLAIANRADARAQADQAAQDQTRAQDLVKQAKVRAIIGAYTAGTPNDPSTNNLDAGIAKAKEVGLPEYIPNLWELHQKEQTFANPRPYETDPTKDQRDPRTNAIITPGQPKMPEIGTPAYGIATQIRDLEGTGPPAARAPAPGAPILPPPPLALPAVPTTAPGGPGAPATTAAPPFGAAPVSVVPDVGTAPPPAVGASGAPPPRLTHAQAVAKAYADADAAKAPPNEFQAFKTAYPATVRAGATWDTLTPEEQTKGLTAFSQRGRDPDAAAGITALRDVTTELARQRLAAGKTDGGAPAIDLTTLPAPIRDQAQALVDGRRQLDPRLAGKPLGQTIINAAYAIDPTFDQGNYNARFTARRDLTNPGAPGGKTIGALNTAIQHAGKLSDLIETLDNSNLPLVNTIVNPVKSALGSTAVTNYQTVAPQLAKEIERVWRGAGGTAGEIHDLIETIGANKGKQQQREALQQFVELAKGKLDALETQRDNVMGKTAGATIPVLFDQNKPILDTIAQRASGATPTKRIVYGMDGLPVK
jgi:hypothetical protein